MKRLVIILLVLIMPLVAAQAPPEPTAYWNLNLSDRMIFVGQDLHVNVTGFPDTFYTINFLNSAQNYTWNQWGRTDENGTSSLHFQSDLDTVEGHYVVTLLVNNSAEASVALDINIDLNLWLKLKVEWLEEENEARKHDDQAVLAQIANDLKWVRKVGMVFLVIVVCFVPFMFGVSWYHRRDWGEALYKAEQQSGWRVFRWFAELFLPPEESSEYGGIVVYAPGEEPEMTIDGDLVPDEVQSIRGKTHDQAVAIVHTDIERTGQKPQSDDYQDDSNLTLRERYHKYKVNKLKKQLKELEGNE